MSPQAQVQTEWLSYFSRGQWRYYRTSFAAAGQDSFTSPPGQNEDMFELMQNVLPPVQSGILRRWGYTQLNNTISTNPTLTSVVAANLYFDTAAGQRRVVWPIGTSTIGVTNENGSTYVSTLFVPAAAPCRMVSSRGYAYFASGNAADLQKWNGNNSGGLSTWGIDIQNASGGANGPNTGASGVDQGTYWTNPSNVNSTTLFATANIGGGPFYSSVLYASNYGFALASSARVSGIKVVLKAKVSANSGNGAILVGLTKDGVVLTGTRNQFSPTTTLTTFTFGSTSYLWGSSWQPADINASTFGVFIQIAGGSNLVTYSVDSLTITVYAGTSAITVGAPGAGNINLVSGRIYFLVFENSTTMHISDLSPPSASTGALTNNNVPLSNLGVSNDSQVGRKKILATPDGGDETLLYELADIPNSQTTYTDNTPDTSLVLNNVYLVTDDFGNQIGVADNSPPPATLLFPTAHRGRLYGAVSHNLFFSKAESELLTTSGTLTGKFEECWPPLNYFTVTTGSDVITGLLTDGQVLYIGTTRKIVRLFGDGPSNFQVPEALFNDVGVLNQDVWRIVWLEGNPLGAIWLTPDYRVMGSDFNTYQDLGVPVQNILDSINKSVAASVTWSAYAANSVHALYLLAIPTGTNTQPDTMLVFDLKGRRWYQWNLADVVVGGIFNITQAGSPVTYFMSSTGTIYQFDPTVTQDRNGSAVPLDYSATLRTSWLSMTDAPSRKYLNEIEVSTSDPSMTVTVEGASTVSLFSTPNVVVSNRPLVVKPRGEFAVFLATAPAKDHYYRFTFTSPATTTQPSVLKYIGVEGGILHRI